MRLALTHWVGANLVNEFLPKKLVQRDVEPSGNRLDPPMSLILDEMANFGEAWEGLVSIISDGGGVGISAWPVLQSMAHVRNFWGNEAASAIFDSATVKVQLGGASN